MRLRLNELQNVVKQAIDEERAVESLRNEIKRVLGPAVITDGGIAQIAEAANERIDVLERTGRSSRLDFKPSITVRFLNHTDPGVRKFAVRVAPEKFLSRLVNDKNHAVRSAMAQRSSAAVVREMVKRFPKDDALRVIYKQKRLVEAGVAQPKVQDEPFDMYGEDKLGDSVKQDCGVELSEQWYRTQAMKLMQDYGRFIEDSWEERAAHQYASNMKATSGVEIDEVKLLKAIKTLIEEREDRQMDRSALKETLSWLKTQAEREILSETAMPVIGLDVDPVRELVEGNNPSSTFIDASNELFNVRHSTLPPGIRKHRLGERNAKSETFPVVGYLPHNEGFRAIDEKALDMYCEAWNTRQSLQGEPLKIEWSNHPDQVGKVCFTVVLK